MPARSLRLYLGMVLSAAVVGAAAPAALAASTYTVTVASGTGAGSLSAALTQANADPGSTIAFDLSGPIQVAAALPPITQDVTVEGSTDPDGEPVIEPASGYTGGIFSVTAAARVVFDDITVNFVNDTSSNGGAVDSTGSASVTVVGSTFDDDTAVNGGALADGNSTTVTTSFLTTVASTFDDDTATQNGGAIATGPGARLLGAAGDVFTGNVAGADGGAVYLGASGATGIIDGSTFDGNHAYGGLGGALYDDATVGAETDITLSTFAGDILGATNGGLGSASATGGYALDDASGVTVNLAGNLFAEDCGSAPQAGTAQAGVTSTGYNAAVPAAGGGAACAGSGTGDAVNANVASLVPSPSTSGLLEPDYPNAAIGLIPVTFVNPGASSPLCLSLAGASAFPSGYCDAGAEQVSAGGPSSGAPVTTVSASTGATATPTSLTSPVISSTLVVPKPKSRRTVKLDDQRITLVTPSLNVCTAPKAKLSVTLTSTRIARSKQPRLRFVKAVFTAGGRDTHTAKRLPSHVALELAHLKPGATDKLVVKLSFRRPLVHGISPTVTKTLKVRFKLC